MLSEKVSTKNIKTGKIILHLGRKDKNILRETKPERIYQHQTSSSRSFERSVLPGKLKTHKQK